MILKIKILNFKKSARWQLGRVCLAATLNAWVLNSFRKSPEIEHNGDVGLIFDCQKKSYSSLRLSLISKKVTERRHEMDFWADWQPLGCSVIWAGANWLETLIMDSG